MRSRLNDIAVDIAALPMDEPPSQSTLEATDRCRAALVGLIPSFDGRALGLLDSMIRCLGAARQRQVLYVFAVPHLVAAAELLASPTAATPVAIEGSRFEIDSLVPPSGRGRDAPDVPLSALSRGAEPDKRD